MCQNNTKTDHTRVTLRTLAGAEKIVDISMRSSLVDLRTEAAALFGIAADELTLISAGRRLGEDSDDETVSDLLWLPLGAVDS